ncbi:unnamed protein product [Ilex paraguariensis]|uniref:Uncharacterized protein n=1 Tax=Ilex paraguariensis TaxID=185542 RepID=A0ABC8RFR3_9AQUA
MSYGWLHQNRQASEAQCDQQLSQMKHVMINAVQQNSVQVWSDHRKYDYSEHNENDNDLWYDQAFYKFDSEVGYGMKKLDYGVNYFHSHNEGKRVGCHDDDHDVDLGDYHGQWAWMTENGSASNIVHELIVVPEDHQSEWDKDEEETKRKGEKGDSSATERKRRKLMPQEELY